MTRIGVEASNLPAPIKLYRATFSPEMTDSNKKLYFESLAMRRYAMHGVMRSAGTSTYTGTQLPRFSCKISFSTVANDGYAGNFYSI